MARVAMPPLLKIQGAMLLLLLADDKDSPFKGDMPKALHERHTLLMRCLMILLKMQKMMQKMLEGRR